MRLDSYEKPCPPLSVDEVVDVLMDRWGVRYDMRIVIKDNCIYLHIMWAFLEQKSFYLSEDEYLERIAYILEILNRLGNASKVREWLLTCSSRPRLGKAVSLTLKRDHRSEEFLI